MQFEDVYKFFKDPPSIYLNKELAVCYVLAILLQQDSYGTELIHHLSQDYSGYRLSDTVLYSALKFLEEEEAIDGYWQKVEGRGRPRRMYSLNPNARIQAEELAALWQSYMKDRGFASQPQNNVEKALASSPKPLTSATSDHKH